MKRLLPTWTLLVLIASFFLLVGPAGACSCAMVEPAQMLEFGPNAFVGTVTEVVPGGGRSSAIFTFEVETVLAGEVPAVVDVTTADNSAACGFDAAIGTRMGVFATDDGTGTLSSSLCSTTDADAAIKALGPGTPPAEGTGTPAPGSGFDWQAVWLGAGGITIVGAVWLFGRRRG